MNHWENAGRYMDRLRERAKARVRQHECIHAEMALIDCATYQVEAEVCTVCEVCMGVGGDRCADCSHHSRGDK